MIVPLQFIWVSGIGCCRCPDCEEAWHCVDLYMEFGGLAPSIIECDKCLKAVFYDEIFEDKYLASLGIPRSKRRDVFLQTLPLCSCGGHFRQPSQYHATYGERNSQHKYPICPACPHQTPSIEWLDIKSLEYYPWVNYMLRVDGVGPNDAPDEILPDALREVNLNDNFLKPKLTIGQGLINSKVTLNF